MQTMDKMHLEKCLAMGLYLIITGNQPLYNSLKTKKKTRNETTIPGTQPVSKDQILYIYDTSTFQNSRSTFGSFYFRFWPAPDKGKTCQRRTDKQEIGWKETSTLLRMSKATKTSTALCQGKSKPTATQR